MSLMKPRGSQTVNPGCGCSCCRTVDIQLVECFVHAVGATCYDARDGKCQFEEPCLNVEVLAAAVQFIDRQLAAPLVLSTGTIQAVTEARTTVTVRVGSVLRKGRGAVYLSDLWSWPDASRSHESRDAALREACRVIAGSLSVFCGDRPSHPLERGLRLHACVSDWHACGQTRRHEQARDDFRRRIDPAMPELARILCASPFDAALHDAAGLAVGRSAFQLYDPPVPIPAADPLFPGEGVCSAIARSVRAKPRRVFPATLVVGPRDSLDAHLDQWVLGRHYRRVKLKILGHDPAADARRAHDVVQALIARGVAEPWLSLDANEAYRDAAQVAELVDELARYPATLRATRYLEQPTPRAMGRPVGEWRPVTSRVPVFVDEALTSPASLEQALQSGWSGAALKTCKGHSFCLVAAAWSIARGFLVALQDLTNPGYAALHGALFGAFVPTINGLELNAPQFTPAANVSWLPHLAELLEPMDGVHRLPAAVPAGLGSQWLESA